MIAHVHIGSPKTGTSAIQEFCYKNRSALLSHGVLYPHSVSDVCVRRGRPLHPYSHFPLTFLPPSALLSALKKELLQTRARRLLISSEHLYEYGRERILALRDLLRDLGCREILIIAYLREQGALHASWSSQQIKGGDTRDHRQMLPDDDPNLAAIADHAAVLQRWGEVFGEDNLRVRLFEREAFYGGDLLEDFLQAADLNCQEDFVRVQKVNEKLNLLERELLLALNRLIPGFVSYPNNLKYLIWQHLGPALNSLSDESELKYTPPRRLRHSGGHILQQAMNGCAPASSPAEHNFSRRIRTRRRTAAWEH